MKDVIGVVLIGLGTFLLFTKREHKCKKAIAIISQNASNIQGHVTFVHLTDCTMKVICSIYNLQPGKHGFHVHRSGDVSQECKKVCSHYNPENKKHGGTTGVNRHKGDLGNVVANQNGICTTELIAACSVHEIIGRSIVIHENEDDLGTGCNEESTKTGNAGAKLACGVIGIAD